MSDLSNNFKIIEPYTPGEQPLYADKVKLNTNENPYPPSPAVAEALRTLRYEDFNLYPDPTSSELTGAIAKYCDIDENMVFAGVGSDDVLAASFMAFFNSGKKILFPDITYAFYDVWANLFGIPYEQPPLDENFKIVKEDYYADNGGIVFPNPNAPTGILTPVSEIEDILKHNTASIVIVDEAYIDFGGESALKLINKYENLAVTRTFSKSRSLAGMRIGFAVANPKLIAELNKVKYSYNSYTLNIPSIKLGTATLADEKYFRTAIDKIISTRERTKTRLAKLGFTFTDSKSNFIFATHKFLKAEDIFNALKREHIFVRYFNKPRIDNYLRITIGTDEEMDKLIDFLSSYIEVQK